MAEYRSKIGFGNLANVETAVTDGTIDEYDIVCVKDGDVAKIGWIDKEKNVVIATPDAVDTEVLKGECNDYTNGKIGDLGESATVVDYINSVMPEGADGFITVVEF